MEPKHSGLGIASFVTSVVSGLALFFVFVIAGAISVSTPGGMGEESIEAIMVGFALFFFVFTSLIALGLGIGGLFQKERRKVFAVLGTVIATAMILATVSLVLFGLSLE